MWGCPKTGDTWFLSYVGVPYLKKTTPFSIYVYLCILTCLFVHICSFIGSFIGSSKERGFSFDLTVGYFRDKRADGHGTWNLSLQLLQVRRGQWLNWLVVYPPLWKNMTVSWDVDIPNIWKKKTCSNPPISLLGMGCHIKFRGHTCSNHSVKGNQIHTPQHYQQIVSSPLQSLHSPWLIVHRFL